MILSPEKNKNLLATILEFSYAEYGSALEMLTAAKKTSNPKLKVGYIRHALDEYRHTFLLHKILHNQIKNGIGKFENKYRFSPKNVIAKGYIDKSGFLVEKLKLKKFVEFVYSNEYLAKQSFEYLSKRISDTNSLNTINEIIKEEEGHADDSLTVMDDIMKDENIHHGMAKKFYLTKFSEAQLKIAFTREKFKNRMRTFYFKNLKFLGYIFDPILNFLISIFGKIVNLISVADDNDKNLMSDKNSNSVV